MCLISEESIINLEFKNKLKYLSLLNAIIEPDWECRYYSYNSKWSENEEMSSLRDSCGGEWFIWFSGSLIAYKCTSPEDGLYDQFHKLVDKVPEEYSLFVNEPAFSMSRGSAIWYLDSRDWVELGLAINDLPNPKTIYEMSASIFCEFVEDFYEQELDEGIVEKILNGDFSIEMAKKINPDIDLASLKEDMNEIGINNT